MIERWLPVAEAPAFEVSDFGRVRRVTAAQGTTAGRVAKLSLNGSGYPVVGLSRDGHYFTRLVHRLVAVAFIGAPPSDKHHAAHCNGQRDDARASNLRWATAKENAADRIAHGTNWHGEKHRMATLSNDQVREIKAREASGYGKWTKLAAEFGTNRRVISNIRNGTNWKEI